MSNILKDVMELVNRLVKDDFLEEAALETPLTDADGILCLIQNELKKEFNIGLWAEDVGVDGPAGEDYEKLIKFFVNGSNNDFNFEKIRSKTEDEDITLTFIYKGKEESIEFEHYSDHLSTEFLDAMIEYSKTNGEGQFINLQNENYPQIGYLPNYAADFLYQNDLVW